jgi:hypothetical protein
LTLWPWVAKFRQPSWYFGRQKIVISTFLKGIVKPSLRICSLCLQEQPYIRILWRLARVHTCLAHKCKLQGQCHVCQSELISIEWNSQHLCCTNCRADLCNLPVVAASAGMLSKEENQQADFRFLLNPNVSLVDEIAHLDYPYLEQLPQVIGLKLRYLRCQRGYELGQMNLFLSKKGNKASHAEHGNQTTLETYLTYLETLSYSWREFAQINVPSGFNKRLTSDRYMSLRLCPNPYCPNHKPPTNTQVRYLWDSPKSKSVAFFCTTCRYHFIRKYTGELIRAH